MRRITNLLLIGLVFTFAGCASGTLDVVRPDGSSCHVTWASLGKDFTGVRFAACHEVEASADISRSKMSDAIDAALKVLGQ